jgi:hypothetical protein
MITVAKDDVISYKTGHSSKRANVCFYPMRGCNISNKDVNNA